MIQINFVQTVGLILLSFLASMLIPYVWFGNGIVSLVLFIFIWIPVSISWAVSYFDYKKSECPSYKKFWILEQLKD